MSSLYVFDALSRAARHQVNKQGLTGDMNSTEGNCATFLLKVEGVLEGLFQDMIMVGSSEAKVSFVLNSLICDARDCHCPEFNQICIGNLSRGYTRLLVCARLSYPEQVAHQSSQRLLLHDYIF